MKKGYYITADGKKVDIITNIFPSVYLPSKNINHIVLPDKIQFLSCRDNNLNELIIPEGTKEVFCANNNLTNIIIPDSVTYISADIKAIDLIKYKHAKTEIRIHLP